MPIAFVFFILLFLDYVVHAEEYIIVKFVINIAQLVFARYAF